MNTKKTLTLIIVSILCIVTFLGTINLASAINYNVTISNDGNGTIFLHINSDPPQYYWTTGTHSIPSNTGIRFTATPNEGYHFLGWKANGVMLETSLNPMYTTVLSSFTLQAIFTEDTVYYDITINNGTHGSMSLTQGATTYFEGTIQVLGGSEITLTSIPDQNYSFYRFISGNSVFNSDPFSILVSGDASFTPEFILTTIINDTYLITLGTPDNFALVSMQTLALDGSFPISSSVAGVSIVEYNSTAILNAVPLSSLYELTSVTLDNNLVDLTTLPISIVVGGNVSFIAHAQLIPIDATPTPTPTPTGTFTIGTFIWNNSYTAILVYIASIFSIIVAFFYLHNNNIPFAVGLGLIIGTIACTILDILGVYTYPIIALVIIVIVAILVFMRH